MTYLLVTGSEGYIGSEISQHFINKGFKIIGITKNKTYSKNSSLEYINYNGNFKNLKKIFQKFQIDCVFHLASNQKIDINEEIIEDMISSNISFGIHLLEAMLTSNCRKFVNVETFWQYNEDSTYRPMNFYAASKQAFSDFLKWYSLDMGINAISLKLFDTYGPNDKRMKIFNILKQSRDKERDVDMTKGEQILYPVHLKDIIKGFEITYNLLSKKADYKNPIFSLYSDPITLYDLVNKWIAISPKKIKVNWGAIPYRKSQIMNPYLGDKLPGWKATVDVSKGLLDTI